MSFPTVKRLLDRIEELPDYSYFGRVTAVSGMMVEIGGVERRLTVGGRCRVESGRGRDVLCEVVGFRNGRALLLPFGAIDGIGLGCKAYVVQAQSVVYPDDAWLGRVINALAEPVDGKGPIARGPVAVPVRNTPPPAHARQRVGGKMDIQVRALNTFAPLCFGQRMGIFAGSGVGKSSLMGMLARYAEADVSVIGLIGERGREVQEFITEILGPEGLKRSIVVVATGDETPLMRRQAAYVTLAVAESFRDAGKNVLCLMDSVTRFAMAQREIGLSAGEPPATKGYPPTTFSELAKLLERAGPGGPDQGSITGLFSVLVEGDDHNEPISDAVRGILDGHIVMDRRIAERGRYPSIDILRSVSRALPECNNQHENELLKRAREFISAYEDMAELIRLGAYREGSDRRVDAAIKLHGPLEAFLAQAKDDPTDIPTSFATLEQILSGVNA